MASSEAPKLRVSFGAEGVSAVAELDWSNAAATGNRIIAALPISGEAFHGIYSAAKSPVSSPLTSAFPGRTPQPGYFPARSLTTARVARRSSAIPTICPRSAGFYDRDANPSTPDGPVAVNVFGRFTDGWEELASLCRRMRVEGAKPITVERV